MVKWLIAGLGNLGPKYESTRHNAGFLFIDSLKIKEFKNKFNSCVAESEIAGISVLFLKPMTFMNLSGSAVISALNFYKLPIENLIIIFDDISLPFGKIRIRKSGSSGGHNGIKDIINSLGTDNFKRIKIGIGENPNNWDLKNWVLSSFSNEEKIKLQEVFKKVYSSLETIIKININTAMNNYN
jgi:PTH1 family peptidyl-tRNA hydrolase